MAKSTRLSMPIAAGHRRPADHRRQRAGGAADDDVLRRPALQPHRVDDDVEEDGEGEQRRRRASWWRGRERSPSRPTASRRRRARRPGVSRPAATGRPRVRRMIRSISASYHMFSAPDAPAPTAIASSAAKPMIGWMPPGAITIPVSAVNTTSDITRGFSSAKKSPTEPSDASSASMVGSSSRRST